MSFLREANSEPLPGYRLIEPLGSGGFGEVWKCEAPGGLFKAIKFVYGNLNSMDVEGVRAEQELKSLQRIKEVRHPFVISTERIEVVDGELLIVMELADKSLHDEFIECQTAGLIGIPQDALMRYVRDAAEALDHMNEKHSLQHLDIKPRNLFLVSDRVKVADFGLVKDTQRQTNSGVLGGVTPLYASPETFGGKISPHSDQYSLAVVYQELLSGHRPFSGKNIRQLAQQHQHDEPELRSLPEPQRPILARALAKDPNKRFPNCLAFVRALYNARVAATSIMTDEPAVAEKGKGAKRAKTLHETLEDFQLENVQLPEVIAKPADYEGAEVSNLGITVAQPQTGALRPTIIIGVGGFGRRAMLELRCRFLDRFGDLAKMPLLRFLYLDTDQEAIQNAQRGEPDVSLAPRELYHMALQPVGNYRRRQLDQLTDWLPREKLYALPRSLKTQGCRALGRLAFADNHLRLLARIKNEIQKAAHPDSLYKSVNETGLAMRDGVPRIYILAGAGGGNSGCLVDLGYGLRRVLHQLGHHEAPVTAMVLCGAPEDPATPRIEQANLYATLTELNHFADPHIPFAAQYGTDGPRIADEGQPYDCIYLLKQTHRTPESLRDIVAHLRSYLFHELTTPLGLRLDRGRHLSARSNVTPFRSFGTHSVWFPRGLMLRLAARRACKQLIEEWQGTGEPSAVSEIDAACARVLAEPHLQPEVLATRIEDAASKVLDAAPAEALTRVLAVVDEQSQQVVAQDDPGNWARQAANRVRDWLGNSKTAFHDVNDWKKSRLARALSDAAQMVAEAQDVRLAQAAFGLMENPGRRVSAAEVALSRFLHHCEDAAAAHEARLKTQTARTEQAWNQLQVALAACMAGNGGFSFFGGSRARRSLRVFVDHLAAFARQCLSEDVSTAVAHVFQCLRGRVDERLRDLAFCRQRLRHLQESLDAPLEDLDEPLATSYGERTGSTSPIASAESFWESIRHSETTRVVLPDGEVDLERASIRFLGTLKEENWMQLDQSLQDQVLAPQGGLHAICMCSADLMRQLAGPLMERAAQCLGEHLPATDVAHVEFSSADGSPCDTAGLMHECFDCAAPLVSGKEKDSQHAFLLLPATDSGKAFGEKAEQAVPQLQIVRVPGQADLMFCCEQDYLLASDMQRLLKPCRPAYEESAPLPQSSPHARFDIGDWIPIDP
jgi:hypothetical protein